MAGVLRGRYCMFTIPVPSFPVISKLLTIYYKREMTLMYFREATETAFLLLQITCRPHCQKLSLKPLIALDFELCRSPRVTRTQFNSTANDISFILRTLCTLCSYCSSTMCYRMSYLPLRSGRWCWERWCCSHTAPAGSGPGRTPGLPGRRSLLRPQQSAKAPARFPPSDMTAAAL